MNYVVTEACIQVQVYMDCVGSLPRGLLYEGGNMLIIQSGECMTVRLRARMPSRRHVPDTEKGMSSGWKQ